MHVRVFSGGAQLAIAIGGVRVSIAGSAMHPSIYLLATPVKIKSISRTEWKGPEDPGVFAMVDRHEALLHSLAPHVSAEDFNARLLSETKKYNDPNGD